MFIHGEYLFYIYLGFLVIKKNFLILILKNKVKNKIIK